MKLNVLFLLNHCILSLHYKFNSFLINPVVVKSENIQIQSSVWPKSKDPQLNVCVLSPFSWNQNVCRCFNIFDWKTT